VQFRSLTESPYLINDTPIVNLKEFNLLKEQNSKLLSELEVKDEKIHT
jgi:hypothetical protein